MSSRRCPRCNRMYADPARFCPQDGSPLVEVAGGKPASETSAGLRTMVRQAAKRGPGMDRASTLSNTLLDERYEVGKRLGEGGMSYVYLAKDLSNAETVAIKVLTPKLKEDKSSVERLRREAGLAMRLDHPNVCRIFRLGETEDGLIYLVMPYLAGELLSDREVRQGALPLDLGVPLLVQMTRGLQHAHDLQIIHRDLKPENVMLVPDDQGPGGVRAVVMDFGLAKERRQEPEVAKLTATGIVLGTPEFMSPEQIRGKPLDARSDIYALAIVAFEMFTGQLPFQGRNAQEMMIARLRGKPKMLREVKPDLPGRLEQVLTKAMALDPADRFTTMGQFAEALEGAEDSGVFAKLFRK
ncbi:MAG: serine/threonine protein kinase [Gemmatimonadetes bacterium]|nr:serine/threonine protein kinase [Gemmatimonadota bacterium]MBP6670148.1 serine/threonine protein kinase [Gemmatimonadales bacterium]MBK7351319.1 serine/threonine protein kinase [Gemmatimonadota bacterium]MBK7715293.1 serine/threonine protein kinase [Gemmatimonadota bacterium]MBK7786481.1 serine/threonine protein kinase [Gemmatimonadota bacterium]